MLGVGEPEQFLPQCTGEGGVAVENDRLWQAMQLVDVGDKSLLHLESSERMLQGNEMSIPRELIDDHQDRVGAGRTRKALNEIH